MNFSYIYFIIARVLGLALKPILLLYLINTQSYEASENIAKLFLYTVSFILFLSVPLHFDFYKKYFSQNASLVGCRKKIIEYFTLTLWHVIVVTPFIFVISFYLFENIYFPLFFYILILSEKLFDEISRFYLYNKSFLRWSIIFTIKSLLPFLFVIITSLVKPEYILEVLVISITLINFLIFILIFPSLYKLFLKSLKLDSINFMFYLKIMQTKLVGKFSIGIFKGNLMNLDKWALSFYETIGTFSEVVMIGQISNSIPLAADFAFVQHRRARLIKIDSLSEILLNFKVPIIMFIFGVLVIIGVIFLAEIDFIKFNTIDSTLIVLIVFSYVMFSIAEPISEYLFWNSLVKYVILIDFLHYVVVVSAALVFIEEGSFYLFYIFLLSSMILRLLLFILLTIKTVAFRKGRFT